MNNGWLFGSDRDAPPDKEKRSDMRSFALRSIAIPVSKRVRTQGPAKTHWPGSMFAPQVRDQADRHPAVVPQSMSACPTNPDPVKPNLMVHAQSPFQFNAERVTVEPKMSFEALEDVLL